MKTLNNGPINHSLLLDSGNPGPNIIIQGGTHPNELVGIDVVKHLTKNLSIISGKVTLIIGHPLAGKTEQRFVNQDINTLMDAKTITNLQQKSDFNLEEKRALELADFYQSFKPDILVDIHNTINPSDPFIYCEYTERHLQYLRYFETAQHVYSPAPEYTEANKSAMDSYVDTLGGVGICYETGHLGDGSPKAMVQKIQEEILNLLSGVGVIDNHNSKAASPTDKNHYEIFERIIAQGNLEFTKSVGTGVEFKVGEIVAHDNETPIFAPEDCVMLFPKGQTILPGELACELARITNVPRIFSGRNDPGVPFYEADLLI